jgi:hypothetical protein
VANAPRRARSRRGIAEDLIEVFGKRAGPHGHDEPALEDDTDDAVKRASAAFDGWFRTLRPS